MSDLYHGNGTDEDKDKSEKATEDVRNIPTGDLIVALFFCIQNEFTFIHNLEMMNAASPDQQKDLAFITQFKGVQKQLEECKEAREKVVQEFNERYEPADNLRRSMVKGSIDLGFGRTGILSRWRSTWTSSTPSMACLRSSGLTTTWASSSPTSLVRCRST
jgi:hypothetical protein